MRTALRGYRKAEVDAFLDRCAAALGQRAGQVPELRSRQQSVFAAGPPLTPYDVSVVQFRTGWRGYGMDEVDGLLERIQAALRA